ncbi:MAG: hypothetical protein WCF33_04590 [Pseudonocardiaceae bacterium]
MVADLEPFVTRRLLITDTDNGSAVVGVAHEAFLSTWAPLAQAIAANVSALRTRRVVEQAATEWDDEGRPPVRLWERGNSPPRWPTPAPTSRAVIWSPIESSSARRRGPSCGSASAGTATGGDAR